ncbi:MAG UNVERIFIED_CONTAM: hypothetical protein LVR29_23100, partial [Microcystis novacekii LVE1205-3]
MRRKWEDISQRAQREAYLDGALHGLVWWSRLGDAFLIDTPLISNISILDAQRLLKIDIYLSMLQLKEAVQKLLVLLPGLGVPNFIVCESVIAYQFAREMDATELASLITAGSPIPKGS